MCGQQVALSATQGPHRAGPVDMLTCQGVMLLAIAFHDRDLDVSPDNGTPWPPPPILNTLVPIAVKKVQFRKPAPGAMEAVPSRKRATPINPASAIKKSGVSGAGGVSQRPFRDRVLHLLALRPYRKAELLLRLQKDGLTQADKDTLDSLLQQVCARRAGARGQGVRHFLSAGRGVSSGRGQCHTPCHLLMRRQWALHGESKTSVARVF